MGQSSSRKSRSFYSYDAYNPIVPLPNANTSYNTETKIGEEQQKREFIEIRQRTLRGLYISDSTITHLTFYQKKVPNPILETVGCNDCGIDNPAHVIMRLTCVSEDINGVITEKNLLTDFIGSGIRIQFANGDIGDPDSDHWQNVLRKRKYIGEGNQFRQIAFNLTGENNCNTISCKEFARWIQYHTRFSYHMTNNNCIHYARKVARKFGISPARLNKFHLNFAMKVRDKMAELGSVLSIVNTSGEIMNDVDLDVDLTDQVMQRQLDRQIMGVTD